MIVPAPPPSFFPPPPWPQTPLDGRQELESASHPDFLPTKKQRISENDPSNPFPNPPMNPRMPPPVMKGISKMFFKTRICEKFIQGTCPYGSNCNFAHGAEEVRKPPPNWKEIVASHGGDDRGAGNWVDQQRNIINRLRICRKFYFGEGCPYGEKCNFLHEDPERVRESTAVMVNTNGNWPDHSDSSVSVNSVQESRTTDGVVISVVDNKASSGVVNSASDGKPVYWKTKICNKWEMTGHCPFGEKCHFAHGQGELQKFGGGGELMEADSKNVGVAPPKPLPVSTNYIPPSKTAASSKQSTRAMRLAKLNGPGMISHVYADWIYDLELLHRKPGG